MNKQIEALKWGKDLKCLNLGIDGVDSRCGKDTSGQTKRQGKCSLVVKDCTEKTAVGVCGNLRKEEL